MKYVVDTEYNDGYTAPELQMEAVMLMEKLNPIPVEQYVKEHSIAKGFDISLSEIIDCAACPFGVYIGDGLTDCMKEDKREFCYDALIRWFYDDLEKD